MEDEELNPNSFMMNDDDVHHDDEPLELDDDLGSFKFDEETDDDPEDRYH
jgi:hypothetical protein